MRKASSKPVPVSQQQAKKIEVFWKGVWEKQNTHQPNHPAIAQWKLKAAVKEGGGGPELSDQDWARAMAYKKQASWKAQGPDGISAFWYKAFQEPAAQLQDVMWEMVDRPDKVPGWFVERRTVMLLKD